MDMINKLIKDIEEGIRQSIDAVKSKAALVAEKADELTEEGKKQYRLYDLRSRLRKQYADLGEKLYELLSDKKMRVSNKELTTLFSSIGKTKATIAGLEGSEPAAAPKKKPAGAKAAPKKTGAKTPTGPRRARRTNSVKKLPKENPAP